jgi:hypothetical protein
MRRSILLVLTASLLALSGWQAPAPACDVPVYRYAFEHWSPDPYQVVVVHRGPLDADSLALASALEKEASRANFVVAISDVAECGDGPRLVVRFPAASQVRGVAWEGRLNADAVAALTDSPCRRDIARRLLGGDAVVWVLLQTGQKDADDAAAARIEEELRRPPVADQPPLPSSLVHVSRNDPAEKLLTETLLSSEPDLRGRDEPMAFPVFGRGRVLYALVGAGIKAQTVRHTLDFLIGGCSCTVKRQNPGVDLLLNADWSVITPTTREEPAPPETQSDDLVPLSPLPPAHSPAKPAAPNAEPSAGPSVWLTSGGGVAAILVAATGWLAVRSRKRRSIPS